MTNWNFVVSKVTGLFEMANSILNKGVNATDSFDFAEALQGLSPQVLADLKNKEADLKKKEADLKKKEALQYLSDEAFDGLSDETLEIINTEINDLSTRSVEFGRFLDKCIVDYGFEYRFWSDRKIEKPLNQNDQTIVLGFSPT